MESAEMARCTRDGCPRFAYPDGSRLCVPHKRTASRKAKQASTPESHQTRVALNPGVLPVMVLPRRPVSRYDGQNGRYSHPIHASSRAARWHKWVRDYAFVARWPKMLPWERAHCRITVISSHNVLPDDDGRVAMCKALRDGIATWFSLDDSPRGPITWEVVWQRGAEDATRIEVEETR